MTDLFSSAIEAALCAGIEIMRIYETEETHITIKSDTSPVTQADIAASNIIETILQRTNIPIICEETQHDSYSNRTSWTHTWIVDPLDGTKDFIERNGEFTVNIALIEHNKPTFGVIYIPVFDTLYFGGKTWGAYMISQCSLRIDSFDYKHITAIAIPLPLVQTHNTTIIVASRNFFDNNTKQFIQNILDNNQHATITHLGSSLKFLEVAAGKAWQYPRKSQIHEWDIAAGYAIAEGAGCTVKNIDTQQEISFNTESLLCPGFIVQRD